MIKAQGFGRRRQGVSHANCIKHHKEVHSKLGMGQAEYMGKYVLYYVDRAFPADGSALSDYPWDMFALEWFTSTERWNNFLKWQASEADGQIIASDEEAFLDRRHSYLCAYDETISVDLPADNDVIDVIRLIKLKNGAAAQNSARYQSENSVAAIKDAFGGELRKYVTNKLRDTISLVEGHLEKPPFDIAEFYKIDRNAVKTDDLLMQRFNRPGIAEAENQIADRQHTITFICEEVPYID